MAAERPEIEAALVAQIESLLLDLRARLDRRVAEATGDIVAADELFVLAGQLDAVLRGASEHLHELRLQLDRAARAD